MEKLSTSQMTEYLRNVMELESSIYCQEESRARAVALIEKREKPRPVEVSMPEISAVKKLGKPPLKPETVSAKDIILNICVGTLLIASGIALAYFKIATIIGGFLAFFGGTILIPGIKAPHNNDVAIERYERALQAYQRALPQARESDSLMEAEYQARLTEENLRYQKEKDADERVVRNAEQEIQKLDAPLRESQELLAKYYEQNLIFPKYQNMVAITSIYEYFASGRCSELAGPNGAYNLYESELRQDLIITRLDNILSELEQVKKNQYVLYRELQKTSQVVSDIAVDIKQILANTSDISESSRQIAVSSHITALCSQATAQNTAALKYLRILFG